MQGSDVVADISVKRAFFRKKCGPFQSFKLIEEKRNITLQEWPLHVEYTRSIYVLVSDSASNIHIQIPIYQIQFGKNVDTFEFGS